MTHFGCVMATYYRLFQEMHDLKVRGDAKCRACKGDM